MPKVHTCRHCGRRFRGEPIEAMHARLPAAYCSHACSAAATHGNPALITISNGKPTGADGEFIGTPKRRTLHHIAQDKPLDANGRALSFCSRRVRVALRLGRSPYTRGVCRRCAIRFAAAAGDPTPEYAGIEDAPQKRPIRNAKRPPLSSPSPPPSPVPSAEPRAPAPASPQARPVQLIHVTCAHCGDEFLAKRRQHKLRQFCGVRCRVAAHRLRRADGAAAASYAPGAGEGGRMRNGRCDQKCWLAADKSCECICKGENHGKDL